MLINYVDSVVLQAYAHSKEQTLNSKQIQPFLDNIEDQIRETKENLSWSTATMYTYNTT